MARNRFHVDDIKIGADAIHPDPLADQAFSISTYIEPPSPAIVTQQDQPRVFEATARFHYASIRAASLLPRRGK